MWRWKGDWIGRGVVREGSVWALSVDSGHDEDGCRWGEVCMGGEGSMRVERGESKHGGGA